MLDGRNCLYRFSHSSHKYLVTVHVCTYAVTDRCGYVARARSQAPLAADIKGNFPSAALPDGNRASKIWNLPATQFRDIVYDVSVYV